MSLADLTATELAGRLSTRELSSVEVTRSCLERIKSRDPRVGAFLRVDADAALQQAEAVDKRRAAGDRLGPLAGVPVALKDNLCTLGEPTTCASRMLENFVSPYDATVVERLRAAGAVLIGRTNLDEFAMGGSTENSAFQPTRNPWDTERSPGGSSGGSAACVAARMAPLAVGTDTGGSIRQPAALCGVVGMKPTYGRVSRYGLVAFASSLDQVGPLARTVGDAALLYDAIAGHDPRDTTSLSEDRPACSPTIDQPLAGLRIGVAREHFVDGLDEEVRSAVEAALGVYRSLGASVVDVALPRSKHAVATYYVIAPSEASSNLARYDGVHYGYRTDERAMLAELDAERKANADDASGTTDTALVRLYRKSRSEGFGPEVKRRIMLGTYALSAGYYDAYYLKAAKVRR
ncbi:MAG: Asp-tRNA(Asn)/Glu-tRNA(Gln) amidotransferase subunit GatA, partial [Planctomycetota bacterium]